jgi:hypothetical protein
MAEKTYITHRMVLDNYAVVQLLNDTDCEPGQQFRISSLAAGWNTTHISWAHPQYLFIGVDDQGDLLYDFNVPIPNQVLFKYTAPDLEREAVSAGFFHFEPTCTWIDGDDIQDWLGFASVSVEDAAFLTQCAEAANQFCWRRRNEAGYEDDLGNPDSADVILGTIMYGGALYRQRSSVNEFASFTEMGTATPTGLSAIMKQLLGIPRPSVA